MLDVPIFITCRDRVSDLRRLVDWLEQAGHQRITLVDNDSTWGPLLSYFEETPHEVIRLEHNYGSQALWKAQLVPNERFVLTDPDILPTEECPLDAVEHLWRLMDGYGRPKVGLGLKLDDLHPDTPSLEWEHSLVAPARELAPGVFDSLVDTTFALYDPNVPFSLYGLRTGAPYQARHLGWYQTEIDDELRYYLDHAIRGPGGTTSWEHL